MTDDTTAENREEASQPKENPTYKPEGVWLKAGYMAGVMDQKFENEAAFKAAVEAAGYIVDGNNIFIKDGGGNRLENEDNLPDDAHVKNRKAIKDAVMAAFADKTELTPAEIQALTEQLKALKNEDPAKKPLTVDGKEQESGTPLDDDWIKKKIEYYNSIADSLDKYVCDTSVTDGFKASFNGGEIHYSSPDYCTVSKDAGLKVYETLVTENDNKGRAINFGPNLDQAQAKNLLIACLIHGNPIGTNAPELTEEEIKAVRKSLETRGAEVVAAFDKNLAAYQAAKSGAEAPKKEHADRAPTLELSEAAQKIKEIRITFQQMKEEGKIAIEHQGNRDVIVAGKDVPDEQKQAMVNEANALINEAAQLVSEAKKADFIQEKIEFNRARLTDDNRTKAEAGRSLSPEKINADIAARERRDYEMSVKLGIIEPTDDDKAAGLLALTGDELKKYINGGDDGKISAQITKNIFARLYTKAQGQPQFNAAGKTNFDESKLTDTQKDVFTSLKGSLKTELAIRDAHTRS